MKTYDMPQYSPEWWAIRKGIPTASAFDRIFTGGGKISGQQDDYIAELIGDKLGIMPSDEERKVQSYAMERGTQYEEEARRWYEMETNAAVQRVGFCTTDAGTLGCSPDAFVGENGVLELKCPLPKTHVAYCLRGTLPLQYKPQVHGHLIVTGRLWCDFVSYCPGLPPFRVRVEPDGYTEQLANALTDFKLRLIDAYLKIREMSLTPGELPG